MPGRSEVESSRKGEETRTRILEAALGLFREKGFETATMRDIAEAAGLATGAAYYYFPLKDSIVLEFYERASAEMQTKQDDALVDVNGLEHRLHEVIRGRFDGLWNTVVRWQGCQVERHVADCQRGEAG